MAGQGKAWTPPETTIPADFVKVTKALLGKGLDDPRGGVFSKLVVGSRKGPDGKEADVIAFGWAMEGKRYVTVNGNSAQFVRNERPALLSELYRNAPPAYPHFLIGAGSRYTDRPTLALPALLLIRGEAKMAEECYRSFEYAWASKAAGLAGEVAMNLHQRALNLYAAGNYKGAIGSARQLLSVRKLAWERAEAEKIRGPYQTFFIEPVLVESERRLKNPVKPIDLKAVAKLPQAERIKQLIQGLDQVRPQMIFMPGGVFYDGDPIFDALVREKDAAVEPVLHAIANDDRMTGSLLPARNGPPIDIISVQRVASQALRKLWPASEFIGSLYWEAWQKHKKLSEAERWLDIVRDDSVDWRGWQRAAERLTQPDMSRTKENGEPVNPRILGRELPADELTDALVRRMLELTQSTTHTSTRDLWEHSTGLRLAALVCRLVSKDAQLPLLREISRRSLAFAGNKSLKEDLDDLASPFADLIACRVIAGDESAIGDYRRFLEIDPTQAMSQAGFYQPLYVGREKPEWVAMARELFAEITKDLRGDGRLLHLGLQRGFWELVRSPLIETKEFRQFLSESISIEKKGAVASFETNAYGHTMVLQYEKAYTNIGLQNVDQSQMLSKEQPVSVGDHVAYAVSGLSGAPSCLPALRPELRAEKRKEVQAWLLDEKIDWKSKSTTLWDWRAGLNGSTLSTSE